MRPETAIQVAKLAIPVLIALAVVAAVIRDWVMLVAFIALAATQLLNWHNNRRKLG